MRLAVVLVGGFESLARQAQTAEAVGIEAVWLEETPESGPPLITAAALAARTRVLRLIACVRAGEHPLAIAEAAAVADNCSNGRLILAVDGDDPGLVQETGEALRAALSARPFRHEGERWTIPAFRPENDGAAERIVVTPACVQFELPLWLGRPAVFDVDDGLVARLCEDPERDLAMLRLPDGLDTDGRVRAIERIARLVRPRVIQIPLPAGLEEYWADEL